MCRPFLWQGEVYVGHWVKIGWPAGSVEPPPGLLCVAKGTFGAHSCEFSTLSRLNFEMKQLELKFLFQKPLQGSHLRWGLCCRSPLPEQPPALPAALAWQAFWSAFWPWCRVEKNWGFLEHKGELKIFYSTLPCTAVYKFDAAAPTAAVLVTEVCYSNIKQVSVAGMLHFSTAPCCLAVAPWQCRPSRCSAPMVWHLSCAPELSMHSHARSLPTWPLHAGTSISPPSPPCLPDLGPVRSCPGARG